VYTLIFGEDTRPITADGDLLVFARTEHADDALRVAGLSATFPLPDEPMLTCDLAGTLFLLQSRDQDDNATILDTVNFLLDCAKALDLRVNTVERRILHDVADHFTFSRDVNALGGSRRVASDAILWLFGAIAVRSRLVPSGACIGSTRFSWP
jgi:hypothetical protein